MVPLSKKYGVLSMNYDVVYKKCGAIKYDLWCVKNELLWLKYEL